MPESKLIRFCSKDELAGRLECLTDPDICSITLALDLEELNELLVTNKFRFSISELSRAWLYFLAEIMLGALIIAHGYRFCGSWICLGTLLFGVFYTINIQIISFLRQYFGQLVQADDYDAAREVKLMLYYYLWITAGLTFLTIAPVIALF
jgi:hypothetical protein